MRLAELEVIHVPKPERPGHVSPGAPHANAFLIDSCLRKVWISRGDGTRAGVLRGTEAYAFLLRLICGLESRIQGETDIFGQFKDAWKEWRASEAEASAELSPWIQRLFEDAKEIRSSYLRNLGGGSYGTLVRKLLATEGPGFAEPILVLGAGHLARSVLPYLSGAELWLANRTANRMDELARELARDLGCARVRKLTTPEDVAEGFARAAQAIVCIPFDAAEDPARIAAWKHGGAHRTLIHLGGLRASAGSWTELPGFQSLDDLFELARAQGELRAVQVERAVRVCDEKAKLRALGGSAALQHGWEDLAVFA